MNQWIFSSNQLQFTAFDSIIINIESFAHQIAILYYVWVITLPSVSPCFKALLLVTCGLFLDVARKSQTRVRKTQIDSFVVLNPFNIARSQRTVHVSSIYNHCIIRPFQIIGTSITILHIECTFCIIANSDMSIICGIFISFIW